MVARRSDSGKPGCRIASSLPCHLQQNQDCYSKHCQILKALEDVPAHSPHCQGHRHKDPGKGCLCLEDRHRMTAVVVKVKAGIRLAAGNFAGNEVDTEKHWDTAGSVAGEHRPADRQHPKRHERLVQVPVHSVQRCCCTRPHWVAFGRYW